MEKVCEKCKRVSWYMFLKVYRTNSIYVDEKGRKWKNSKTCPECFSKYNTERTRSRRNRLK